MRTLGMLLAWQLSVAAAPETLETGGAKFTLTLPFDLTRGEQTDEQLTASWHGSVDGAKVYLELRIFPTKEYCLHEPEDVARFVHETYADPEQEGDPGFAFDSNDLFEGSYGYIPYAAYAHGLLPSAARAQGETYVLGGRTPDHAYTLVLEAKPSLSKARRLEVVQFLKRAQVKCRARDHKWTDGEVIRRWRGKPRKLYRTKHYIVMTNASAGNLFARKMEEYYERVRKVFPFREVKGRRLMPVFLFKRQDQYHRYCRDVAEMSLNEAKATKGHAWKDYYATYYESPNDPVHIHEATHQIFMNRLFLEGGGSWFHEGVAEYMCTNQSARRSHARRLAKKDIGPGLRRLVAMESVEGEANYLRAATIIGFLRDGRWQPEKFQTFIHAVGHLPAQDSPALEETIQRIYGTDLRGFEEQWRKHWRR